MTLNNGKSGVSQSTMPPNAGRFYGAESFSSMCGKGIEPPSTFALQKNLLRALVPTGRTDLIRPVVFVVDAKLLKVAGDVVGGACVGVPVGVDPVCAHGGVDVTLIRDVVGIQTMPALGSRVPLLVANLAPAREAALIASALVVGGAIAMPPSTIAAAAAASGTTLIPTAMATRVATPGRRVDGGLVAFMQQLLALLKAEDLGLQFIKGDWLDTSNNGGYQRVVVRAEPSEDVRDKLLIPERFPSDGHLIRQVPHLGDVVSSRHGALLGRRKRNTRVHRPRSHLQRKNLSNRYPEFSGGLGCRDLCHDFTRHGGEQVAQHLLVKGHPSGVVGVGALDRLVAVLDVDLLRWRRQRAVDEPFKLSSADRWKNLRFPEDQIGLGELL